MKNGIVIPGTMMRLVVAIGGNALLKRGEKPSLEAVRANVRSVVSEIADAARDHSLVLVHGSGRRANLAALDADMQKIRPPHPLDIAGAGAQGAIGYLIEQEMRRALPGRPVATLLTQALVDGGAPAATPRADTAAPDTAIAMLAPRRIIEIDALRILVDAGVTVICGGGIPVVARAPDDLHGVEAIVDKDLAAARLAEMLDADKLVILTDIDGVYRGWKSFATTHVARARVAELEKEKFASGSMAPKVEAACRFARAMGRPAFIGKISDARHVIAGGAGTRIDP